MSWHDLALAQESCRGHGTFTDCQCLHNPSWNFQLYVLSNNMGYEH